MNESRVSKMEQRMRAARPTRNDAIGWLVAVALGLALAGSNMGVFLR